MKLKLLLVLSLSGSLALAQNVGINSTGAAPNASAMLDIVSSSKGLLIPRVALTQTTSNSPIGAGIASSLLVYNTATVNDVTPGYYYWDGSKWVTLITSANASTYAGGSSCCSGWTLKSVVNSTMANTSYVYGSAGVAVAGKEYMIIGVYRASEFTLAASDVLFLVNAQSVYPGNVDGHGSNFEVANEMVVNTTTHAGLGYDLKRLYFCAPYLDGQSGTVIQLPMAYSNFWVGLRGDGSFYLRELFAGLDFGIYIFER